MRLLLGACCGLPTKPVLFLTSPQTAYWLLTSGRLSIVGFTKPLFPPKPLQLCTIAFVGLLNLAASEGASVMETLGSRPFGEVCDVCMTLLSLGNSLTLLLLLSTHRLLRK